MNRYAPLTEVKVQFDLIDQDHQPIHASSATFKVYSETGVEVQQGSIPVVGGESSLTVAVLGINNDIADGEINGARTVVLLVETPTGFVELSETYLIEYTVFLAVPKFSAMTVPESIMLAARMQSTVVQVWDEVTDQERRAALMEAWTRLARFPYRPWRDHEEVPAEITDSRIPRGDFSVDELTTETWNLLPRGFREALKRAQLIEASVILGSDPVWDRRVDGLISKTVGESSEMFRSRPPSKTSVSPKAFQEIRPYVRQTIRIGR